MEMVTLNITNPGMYHIYRCLYVNICLKKLSCFVDALKWVAMEIVKVHKMDSGDVNGTPC